MLSKSHFVRGLQCHKSLWLHKHRPELRQNQSMAQQAILDSGSDVGLLAQGLFPDGIMIPYEGLTFDAQVVQTQMAIKNGITTIYEAAFFYNGLLIKTDILHKGPSGWELYEVKSSTECKARYIKEIAMQYFVVTGAGLPLSSAGLVHINNNYVKNGAINITGLFTVRDVTSAVVNMQATVIEQLASMVEMLGMDEPCIDIGRHCSDPYDCDFKKHCWSHIPKHSVFNLGGKGVNKFDLYKRGLVGLDQLPLGILNRRQKIEAEAFQRQTEHIDSGKVRVFLESLWYPLCFLDFETTYMNPVPLFDGTRPYQQVPFQYSLHCIAHKGAELSHHEFLSPPGIDPRHTFLSSLLDSIPEGACILAYNSKFEVERLRELAASFPEYSERIDQIICRVRDLMKPFASRHIYFPQMNGSHSIKVVLPALVPELSYKNLEISNGSLAAESYLKMYHSTDSTEIARTRSALLEYCKLDTLAMVRILEKMQQYVLTASSGVSL